MTITFPLALPSSPNFNTLVPRAVPVVGMTRSPYSGSQQAVVYPGQWWEFVVSLPGMKDPDLAAWQAFFLKLNGREGTFLLGDVTRAAPRGTAASTPGTPTVDGAHNALTSTLAIAGAPALETGWLLEADYLQIGTGSSSRLHAVLNTANTDSNGDVTVDIWPRHRTALAGGEAINFISTKGVFRLTQNSVDIMKRPGGLVSHLTEGFDFTAAEAF